MHRSNYHMKIKIYCRFGALPRLLWAGSAVVSREQKRAKAAFLRSKFTTMKLNQKIAEISNRIDELENDLSTHRQMNLALENHLKVRLNFDNSRGGWFYESTKAKGSDEKRNDETLLNFVDALRVLAGANDGVLDVLAEYYKELDTDEIQKKALSIFGELYKEYENHILDMITDDVLGTRRKVATVAQD